MAGYSLSSLIPEPFIVTDRDGTRYEGKMAASFGAVELARCERLQGEFAAAWAALQSTTGDRVAAAQTVESVVRELVALIVPAMPEVRREALTFAERLGLVESWRAAQPALQPAPKVTASPPTTRGRRSRGSSSPGTTRSAS